jgi:hypothetical protein
MAQTNYGYGVGLRNVGSYQVSGHPFLTGTTGDGAAGTEVKISFPFVTKNITIISSGSFDTATTENSLKVHFNSDSDGDVLSGFHYITLDSEEDSMTFDVKCKEIYITNVTNNASWQMYATLTNIPTDRMYALTGSGLTD